MGWVVTEGMALLQTMNTRKVIISWVDMGEYGTASGVKGLKSL